MFKLLRCTKLIENISNQKLIQRNISILNINRQKEAETDAEKKTEVNKKPAILVEKDTNITLIGINQEESRNSIDSETAQELCEVFHAFEADETSPVAVLYGVGGSFCAGYNVSELEREVDEERLDFLLKYEGAVGPTRRHLKKPVVCGINGFCVANGLELALMCDLRVMEDTAILGFFNRRLGVPLSDGGSARLSALIGHSRALDILLTGRRIYAKEALNIGLVNRVVATGTALGQAVNLAFSIAKFSQPSLLHDRNSVYANGYDQNKFRQAVQNELMFPAKEMMDEIKQSLRRFKESRGKSEKNNLWYIREKAIPEWEKEEIAYELQKGQKEKQNK